MDEASNDGSDTRLVGADRVLAVLVRLGDYPQGVTLDELAAAIGSPKPTVHRALASLRRAGLAAQPRRGTYMLGDEFMRLAFRNFAERPEAALIGPALEELAQRFGETTHYAVLDGDEVVYRAKTDPPRGSMRLTSEVGGRNPAYCTAVGKLLLSYDVTGEADLRSRLGDGPYPRRTPRTLVDPDALWREIELTRERGYAVDDQENEEGVNCVAIPVRIDDGAPVSGAVSVSALAFRTPLPQLEAEVDRIRAIVRSHRPL